VIRLSVASVERRIEGTNGKGSLTEGNYIEGARARGQMWREHVKRETCDGQTRVTGQKGEEQVEEQEARERAREGTRVAVEETHEEVTIDEGTSWNKCAGNKRRGTSV
jgi:hypothetical protein